MLRDEHEAQMFARLWENEHVGDAPVAVHPRDLGGLPVWIRPGTTDAQVVDDTFVGRYHLPPMALSPDACVLDLGANIGCTAAHLATMCPRGKVLAVEMDFANAELAGRTLAPFGDRVAVVHAAAWETDGEIEYAGGEAWGLRAATLGQDPHAPPPGDRVFRVRAARVETLIAESGIDRIDYAKVDVEGAESVIVRPDSGWLGRVKSIKVEYHAPATRQSMQEALHSAGFAVSDDPRHPRCVVGVRSA